MRERAPAAQDAPAPSAEVRSEVPSSQRELEEALEQLQAGSRAFAALTPAARAARLRDCIPRLREIASAWVTRGRQARGLSLAEAGEEWLAGPLPVTRMLRLLAESLEAIAGSGKPPLGTGVSQRADGRVQVALFPGSEIDRALYRGLSAYALLEDGLGVDEARQRQASAYERKAERGVCLVLGAGNVSSIPAMDTLTKMFVDGHACLLKMNPVNEWVGTHLEHALAPLIDGGYLRIVYGGADAGRYLVGHDAVAAVHLTGSDRTHDLIVWGPPGAERERRLAEGRPRLAKPISSELGNVSPVAIVPHTYSRRELWSQARSIVSMVVNNGSFNCNAAKLLITARDWKQREAFLGMIGRALARAPSRDAYYPGAFERYRRLTEGRDDVMTFGAASDRAPPWALIRDVDPEDESDPIFTTEPFCAVLSETALPSADPVQFLAHATGFLNERVWGTLNACLVVHPELERDPTVARALDDAVLELRYGTVAINQWPAIGYAVASMPWGGHPSSTLSDIQSGLGWVHNTCMLEGVEKSVVRGPLRPRPDPIWFYDNRAAARIGSRMVDLEASPGWLKVPGIALRALV